MLFPFSLKLAGCAKKHIEVLTRNEQKKATFLFFKEWLPRQLGLWKENCV